MWIKQMFHNFLVILVDLFYEFFGSGSGRLKWNGSIWIRICNCGSNLLELDLNLTSKARMDWRRRGRSLQLLWRWMGNLLQMICSGYISDHTLDMLRLHLWSYSWYAQVIFLILLLKCSGYISDLTLRTHFWSCSWYDQVTFLILLLLLSGYISDLTLAMLWLHFWCCSWYAQVTFLILLIPCYRISSCTDIRLTGYACCYPVSGQISSFICQIYNLKGFFSGVSQCPVRRL